MELRSYSALCTNSPVESNRPEMDREWAGKSETGCMEMSAVVEDIRKNFKVLANSFLG